MSDLTHIEKLKLERLLGMGGGYVLNFTDRTFGEFIIEATGLYIWDSKYQYASGSKANRMRAFWKVEPNHVVAKLMSALLQYWYEFYSAEGDMTQYQGCCSIVERLRGASKIEEIEALNSEEESFQLIVREVRQSIDNNRPEAALDRLHTFVLKYVRTLCQRHNIEVTIDKPLYSLFGEYVKYLKNNNLMESGMTERILKNGISIFEAFNSVRNNQSLAHDNQILNYEESLLILNYVASTIRFVKSVEAKISQEQNPAIELENSSDDLTFWLYGGEK